MLAVEQSNAPSLAGCNLRIGLKLKTADSESRAGFLNYLRETLSYEEPLKYRFYVILKSYK